MTTKGNVGPRLHLTSSSRAAEALLPRDELLDSIFAVITHVLRARRCSLMVVDQDEHLVVRKALGLDPEVAAATRLKLGERIAGRVAANRKPLLISDMDTAGDGASGGGYATNSFVSVPIVAGRKLYGVLNAADKTGEAPFDEFDLSTLTLLAEHVAVCIENAELHRHVARQASTDGLTGLYNHRYFQERLEEEVERARRFGGCVAVLMADVDSFKEFNDTYGHPMGDRVLQQVASVLQSAVRQSDIVSRYGGDEFAIISPETDEAGAIALGGRLTDEMATLHFRDPGLDDAGAISLAIGVSLFPRPASSKSEIIEQADRAMYVAKQTGRGTCCWGEDPVGRVSEIAGLRSDPGAASKTLTRRGQAKKGVRVR